MDWFDEYFQLTNFRVHFWLKFLVLQILKTLIGFQRAASGSNLTNQNTQFENQPHRKGYLSFRNHWNHFRWLHQISEFFLWHVTSYFLLVGLVSPSIQWQECMLFYRNNFAFLIDDHGQATDFGFQLNASDRLIKMSQSEADMSNSKLSWDILEIRVSWDFKSSSESRTILSCPVESLFGGGAGEPEYSVAGIHDVLPK